jgi:hypothetical protein
MKNLLRSTFIVRPDDDAELLYRNYQDLLDSGLDFETVEDKVIWKFVQDFIQQYHHVPAMDTIQGHFRHVNENDVAQRLDVLAAFPVKVRGNFRTYLNDRVNDHRTRVTGEILKEAAQIITSGITIKEEGGKEKLLSGPIAAIQYVLNRGHDIVMPSLGTRLSGDVTKDGSSFLSECERIASDPLSGMGQFTGITQLDDSLKGAKRGELWTHAAFTGGLKSTLALNWIYNQAVYYRHSTIFFSLEMPYNQVRRLLFSLHSCHEKFDGLRKELGIGRGIPYKKIRDGELDCFSKDELARMPPEEQARLVVAPDGVRRMNPKKPETTFLGQVVKDLEDPANEYGSLHIEVADPDKTDFTVPDLRSKAELLYSTDPDIQAIFVDHMGLMSPRKHHQSTTENLNEVIRDMKKMSMNFNRGLGIAVVGLFQISREGYKAAEKSDGRYNLTHLSYANEAERSSDIVTATYVDDNLRSRNLVRFQCLKARDDQPFEVFYSGVYWPSRLIYTTHDVTVEDSKKAGEEIDLSAAA